MFTNKKLPFPNNFKKRLGLKGNFLLIQDTTRTLFYNKSSKSNRILYLSFPFNKTQKIAYLAYNAEFQ